MRLAIVSCFRSKSRPWNLKHENRKYEDGNTRNQHGDFCRCFVGPTPGRERHSPYERRLFGQEKEGRKACGKEGRRHVERRAERHVERRAEGIRPRNRCGVERMAEGVSWTASCRRGAHVQGTRSVIVGRGDDAVGNPHRAQISQFELFEIKFLNSSCSSLSSY